MSAHVNQRIILWLRSFAVCYCVCALSVGCAQKGRPQGGPPDTVAPMVLSSLPAAGTVQVDADAPIEIEFSEPIDKTKLLQNIFISPKRAGIPEIKWSGYRVRLTWADSLRQDVTYRVTVGAKLPDQHNNPLADPYTFAFSTGPAIDSGQIVGRVWNGIGPAGAFDVLAYELTADAWDPTTPDFQTQTSTDGTFDLPFLPNRRFRLLAVDDRNGNDRPDHGELTAIAPRDVDAATGDSPSVEMFASAYDTATFVMTGCSVADDGSLLIGFSHSIDTATWTPGGFEIRDSLGTAKLGLRLLRPIPPHFAIVPALNDDLRSLGSYKIVYSVPESGRGIRNEFGVSLQPCSTFVNYLRADDTLGPRIQWMTLPTVGAVITRNAPIEWGFSEPIDTVSVNGVIRVFDSAGAAVQGRTLVRDLRHLAFQPDEDWPDTTMLIVSLDSASIKDRHGNRAPSQQFNWTFVPLTNSTMGEVVCLVQGLQVATEGSGWRLTAHSTRMPLHREWRIPDQQPFKIELPAGEWILSAYEDTNNDARFSPGRISPFGFAEPHTVYLDTVSVRARFTVEDVIIKF